MHSPSVFGLSVSRLLQIHCNNEIFSVRLHGGDLAYEEALCDRGSRMIAWNPSWLFLSVTLPP